MPRPRAHDWLEDEIKMWRANGIDAVVSLLTPAETDELGLREEARFCEAQGIRFISHPIGDRQVPDSMAATAGLAKEIRDLLHSSASVAIHCRMGIGRSALFAACVLVGDGWDAPSAFQAIGKARGLEVPDTDAQKHWVSEATGALQA